MTVEKAINIFAGCMILLSVVLTNLVSPLFVWLTVFVGVNLIQSSFTGICPAAIILKKAFGLKTERESVSL